MQRVSLRYEEIFLSQNYWIESKLVSGENEYGEDMLISMHTSKQAFSGNVPKVGCCPSSEINVSMHMPSETIERMGKIVPYVRLVSKDVEDYASEWIKKGEFFIDTRSNTKNDDNLDILTIHGYDAMLKAETMYGSFYTEYEFTLNAWTKTNNTYTNTYANNEIIGKSISIIAVGNDNVVFYKKNTPKPTGYAYAIEWSVNSENVNTIDFVLDVAPIENISGKVIVHGSNSLGFPAKDIDVVLDIAEKIGVNIDSHIDTSTGESNSSILYIDKGYTIEYPSEYTMREVLGYIGAMYGGNWVINDLGELQFIPLWDLPQETAYLINELGYRIVFGDARILLSGSAENVSD